MMRWNEEGLKTHRQIVAGAKSSQAGTSSGSARDRPAAQSPKGTPPRKEPAEQSIRT